MSSKKASRSGPQKHGLRTTNLRPSRVLTMAGAAVPATTVSTTVTSTAQASPTVELVITVTIIAVMVGVATRWQRLTVGVLGLGVHEGLAISTGGATVGQHALALCILAAAIAVITRDLLTKFVLDVVERGE